MRPHIPHAFCHPGILALIVIGCLALRDVERLSCTVAVARSDVTAARFSAPPPDDQTNGRGIEASSVSLFLLALEPEPGLQNDIRSDFEPLQQDDEFERSERGSERGSFGDNRAREIRAAAWDR